MRIPTGALLAALLLCAAAQAKLYQDIPYTSPGGKPLLLDANIPEGPGPFPTAILVHGGSWTGGSKGVYIRPLKPLLENAGYAWFSIDYRLAPANPYPADLQDVEAAVRWVKAHAREYHVDRKRLALIGESAGGHLVALVGAQNKRDTRVKAVVDFYGPNDLSVIPKFVKAPPPGVRELLNITEWNDQSQKLLVDASPTTYIRKGIPPFLFIHGSADTLVPFQFSPMMCDAMKKVGGECQVIQVPNAGHGMESWEGKPGMAEWKPVMMAWLNTHLKVKPAH